jgi:hypothetical protein
MYIQDSHHASCNSISPLHGSSWSTRKFIVPCHISCTSLVFQFHHLPNNVSLSFYDDIVTWMARALICSWPINTSRPNTRYATIGEAVSTPCCFEPREVEDRAVPSRTAPCSFPRQRSWYTLTSRKITLCKPVARQHDMMSPDATMLTGSVFLALFLAI